MEPEGYWPKDDLRRAFVAGAKWWEYEKTKFTMWQDDIRLAEQVAYELYPEGKVIHGQD